MKYIYPGKLSNSSNFNEKANGKVFLLWMFHDSCTVDSGRQHWCWSRVHMMAPISSQKYVFVWFFLRKEKRKRFLADIFCGPKIVDQKTLPVLDCWEFYTACDPFEPETFVYKRLFPLDDEPNLYIKNSCLTTNIHVKTSCLGYPWSLKGCKKKTFVGLSWAPRISPQFAKHGPCVHAVAKAPTAGATSTV